MGDGEKAAVVTSIGPGALQALAAALVPASDGVGVWYLLGDETSEDEGPNMQQIPGVEQNAYLRLLARSERRIRFTLLRRCPLRCVADSTSSTIPTGRVLSSYCFHSTRSRHRWEGSTWANCR